MMHQGAFDRARGWGRAPPVLVILAIALASSGCKKDDGPMSDDPAELAADGSSTHAAESDTEALTASLIGVDARPNAPAGALDLTVEGKYLPKGCFTATHVAATNEIRYELVKCYGRFGLREVSGVIVARREQVRGNLIVNLTGNDLEVNKAKVDWAARAEISGSGAAREMRWEASMSGSSTSGKAFSRRTVKTVKWSLLEPCFSVDGSSTGEVGKRKVKIEIIGFKRCALACPEPGSTIRVTNETTGSFVTLAYDEQGATLTTPNRNTRFTPLCRG